MIATADITWQEQDLPFSTVFGDSYYSHADGRAECAHVFVAGNSLPDRWAGKDKFVIGELGFGTGLNFLETWATWRQYRKKDQCLTFVSMEGFPMAAAQARQALTRWSELNPLTECLLRQWRYLGQGPVMMDDQTRLDVIFEEASAAITSFPSAVDAWYLDGFSPAKNPEMWSSDLLGALSDRTTTGGTVASYTAAGWVRRNLAKAGFEVAKRPGFGTKRDMISGFKRKSIP